MYLRELLIAAKKVILDPKCRSHRALAENKNGQGIDPSHLNAVKWCPIGALVKVGGHSWWKGRNALYQHLPKDFIFISEFNSHASHEQLMALFDRAIENVS